MNDPVKIAVVGAGAVGCWVGSLLSMSGADVTLIGRQGMVDAIRRDGLTLLRGDRHDLAHPSASTELAAAARAELVLLTVKSADTVSAATALGPHLASHAALVCLQNGVDNADRAAAALGRAVYTTAVYVGCEIERPGVVRHLGRGDLVLGTVPAGTGEAGAISPQRMAELFRVAGVPCSLTDDISATLWQKLIINCAYNAISAIRERPYGALLQDPADRTRMQALAEETIAVGIACGVAIDGAAQLAGLWRIGEAMPNQLSSTAQDLMRGKRTEIDALNGLIVELGRTHGVPTPENASVTADVRRLERAAAR